VNKQIKQKIIAGIIIATLIAGGVFFYRSRITEAAWYDNSWHYRKQLTFNNADQSDNLTDFPVMVKLTSSNFLFSKAKSSGEDVRFTDSDGETLLKYEIEKWDADNEEAIIWVKVPQIDGSSATDSIYVYYGNAEASDGQDAENVWNSDYEMVQHLQESPANDAAGHLDSTSNNNDGTPKNFDSTTTSTTDGTGKIDGADVFDGTDDYVEVADSTDFECISGTSDFSIFAWVKYDSFTLEYTIMEQHTEGSNRWHFGATNSKLGFWYNDGTWVTIINNDPSLSTGQWYHLGITRNGSTWKVWKNGGQVGSSASESDTIPNPGTMHIGYMQNNSMYIDGTIDEVKISSTARSADWIAAVYLSESDTFINQSDEEHQGHPVAYWSFDEGYGATANDETVNGNDGTITNAVWQEEDMCVSGKCLYFDGSGDYVDSNFQLDGYAAFSACLWTKTAGADAADRFLGAETGAATTHNILRNPTNVNSQVTFSGGQVSVNSGVSVADDKWHHLCSIYNGSTLAVYIDGALRNSDSASGTVSSYSLDLFIGARNNDSTPDNYLDGTIDEMKIYDYARSAAEIKLDYQNSAVARGASVSIGDKSDSWMSDGLVGYWKMDESSWTEDSADVVDSSGNGNTGTVKDDATVVAGKFGNGGSFDGDGDYVSVTDVASLDITDELTLSVWIKQDTAQEQAFLGKWDYSANQRSYNMEFYSANAFRFALSSDGNWDADNSLTYATGFTTDVWYHMVCTYDGSTMRVYKDGAEVANKDRSISIHSGSAAATIAASLSNGVAAQHFDGSIDEVRIYNRALSEKEVRDLYNWAPGPVMHLKMDEKTGDFAYDISGNENNGTLTGGPVWTVGKYGSAIDFDGSDDFVTVSDFAY